MQDIYSEPEDMGEDEEDTIGENEITKTAYKNVIGRLFRGYVFINFGLLLLTSVLSVDILSGGGSITLFIPFSEQLAAPLPTLL